MGFALAVFYTEISILFTIGYSTQVRNTGRFVERQEELNLEEVGRDVKNAVNEWDFLLVTLENLGEATTRRRELLDGWFYLRSRVIVAIRNGLFELEKEQIEFDMDGGRILIFSKEEIQEQFAALQLPRHKKISEELGRILAKINEEYEKVTGAKAVPSPRQGLPLTPHPSPPSPPPRTPNSPEDPWMMTSDSNGRLIYVHQFTSEVLYEKPKK
ncbi:hypothetical protein TrLO_g14172 [Triparma laevis f. longispina]|uniref:WW domain-containing protein n=1 Tax=Triparma laevis f. longispina TaxID=1714387 RepID=A0A9W7FT92_9STRA|nr:hypothetical protein TrLO_g14172 [Triparma laevis f. longispina]